MNLTEIYNKKYIVNIWIIKYRLIKYVFDYKVSFSVIIREIYLQKISRAFCVHIIIEI